MGRELWEFGIGPTQTLDLRVSVAALARVLVVHPKLGQVLVVLERTATVQETEGKLQVTVKAKPFGGGVRLRDVQALQDAIGEFHFDSERSRQEADFRILIRAEDWPRVQAFCLRHLGQAGGVLETSPLRELEEEFQDALGMGIGLQQITIQPAGIVVEARPAHTASVRAPGRPTVRIYSVREVWLRSPELITAVLDNSTSYSNVQLHQLAWEDWRRGGKGRANAVLILPVVELIDWYGRIPMGERGSPLVLGGHLLDGNVPAILPEVECPKYWRSSPAGPAAAHLARGC